MIKLEHVSKAYSAGIPALNDVNLNIEEGEFVFVVGDSGSGKSTLIKLLLKELEPTEGTITINGRKLNKIKRRQIPKFRRNIGVVFQDFRLIPNLNVYDNIAFSLRVVGRICTESHRRVKPFHQKERAVDVIHGRTCGKISFLPEAVIRWRAAESRDRKGTDQQTKDPFSR